VQPQAPAGVEGQIVAEEPLTAAVSADHPLAKRATVTLDALRDQPLISMPHGSGQRLVLDKACAAAGFRPHVAFEAGDPRLLAELAARGLGIAVITKAAAEARAGGLRPVEITRPRLQARLALAWRAHGATSPAARALIEHARAQLPNRAGIGQSS
jgi:DNA-binding transcriptional LysR family regulator